MVAPTRSAGRAAPLPRDALRRIAFIRVAQRVGPDARRDPHRPRDAARATHADRRRLGPAVAAWKAHLDERIQLLEGLRDELSSCIGCGCLSLHACKLYNPDDRARALGQGPRYLLGDTALDVVPELADRRRR